MKSYAAHRMPPFAGQGRIPWQAAPFATSTPSGKIRGLLDGVCYGLRMTMELTVLAFAHARETFGFSSAQSAFVNLSDGGHFENLGLYEMVARRCKTILVVDGGHDPTFEYEDLGNALRKIRIDLGIPIHFPQDLVRKSQDKDPFATSKPTVMVGTIEYQQVDGDDKSHGLLIYLKPHLWKTAPADILTYAFSNPEFPHQSTGDQFFSESQFESYRALGFEIAGAIPDSILP